MVWLRDSEKILKLCLLVVTEYTNVTDGQTDEQTPHNGIGRAYAYASRCDVNSKDGQGSQQLLVFAYSFSKLSASGKRFASTLFINQIESKVKKHRIDVFLIPRSIFILIFSTFKQVFLAHNEIYNINLLFYLCLKNVNLVHILSRPRLPRGDLVW